MSQIMDTDQLASAMEQSTLSDSSSQPTSHENLLEEGHVWGSSHLHARADLPPTNGLTLTKIHLLQHCYSPVASLGDTHASRIESRLSKSFPDEERIHGGRHSVGTSGPPPPWNLGHWLDIFAAFRSPLQSNLWELLESSRDVDAFFVDCTNEIGADRLVRNAGHMKSTDSDLLKLIGAWISGNNGPEIRSTPASEPLAPKSFNGLFHTFGPAAQRTGARQSSGTSSRTRKTLTPSSWQGQNYNVNRQQSWPDDQSDEACIPLVKVKSPAQSGNTVQYGWICLIIAATASSDGNTLSDADIKLHFQHGPQLYLMERHIKTGNRHEVDRKNFVELLASPEFKDLHMTRNDPRKALATWLFCWKKTVGDKKAYWPYIAIKNEEVMDCIEPGMEYFLGSDKCPTMCCEYWRPGERNGKYLVADRSTRNSEVSPDPNSQPSLPPLPPPPASTRLSAPTPVPVSIPIDDPMSAPSSAPTPASAPSKASAALDSNFVLKRKILVKEFDFRVEEEEKRRKRHETQIEMERQDFRHMLANSSFTNSQVTNNLIATRAYNQSMDAASANFTRAIGILRKQLFVEIDRCTTEPGELYPETSSTTSQLPQSISESDTTTQDSSFLSRLDSGINMPNGVSEDPSKDQVEASEDASSDLAAFDAPRRPDSFA